jgi:hypothetical protein
MELLRLRSILGLGDAIIKFLVDIDKSSGSVCTGGNWWVPTFNPALTWNNSDCGGDTDPVLQGSGEEL